MSKVLLLLGTQFLLIVVEAWFGACGWPLPLAAFGAIYCALAFGLEYGIAGGVLAGMGRCVYGGDGWNLLLIVLYPVLAALVLRWTEKHEKQRGVWLPGVLAGVLAGIPALPGQIYVFHVYGGGALGRFALLWIWSIGISALLYPLILLMGEALTEYLGMPRVFDAPAKGKQK